MRESRILKILSYILLPILLSSIILSIVYMYMEQKYVYNTEKYFLSQSFGTEYMNYLRQNTDDMIHNSTPYILKKDNEIEIHFITDDLYNNPVKNRYFLIIYKHKALTNVELTSQTNTIQTIKKFIEQNPDSKKVNIIYGNVESDSEIIQSEGTQYLDMLTQKYYTKDSNDYIEYITAEAKDLEIYSSYQEEFKENTYLKILNYIENNIPMIKEHSDFIIPISSVLILLILIFLIISIGYKKGHKEIDLNDFDKIPLEIIVLLALIIVSIPFIISSDISNSLEIEITLIITIYLIVYTLCAVLMTTIIKRIKAKKLLKTSIIGIVLLKFIKLTESASEKFKKIKVTLADSTSISIKVFLYFMVIAITGLAILIIFNNNFVIAGILELGLIFYVLYKIIKVLRDYIKIEDKLKEMYEGNNKSQLNETEYSECFKNSIKYLNNISNGFETAIQDRIKGERFKAELITNVSHDIKTPLTSIINYVDLLKKENVENEKAKEYIDILEKKSQRLKKLTEDLVEASKVSTGNISLNLENINIVELIKQALGEFEDKFKKQGLETILNSKENEIIIKADNKYMYRIVENLFSNIYKYALENSRVYIDIKKNSQSVIIEIKNISKEKLNISADELLQRFVRGDKSRNTEGSGLGISIAQNLTELQGGKFTLKLDGDLFKVELEWKI